MTSGRGLQARVEGWRYLVPPAPESALTAQRPLRVVWLDHTAKLSGGELAMLRLAPHLPSVTSVVVLAEDGPLRPRLEAAGVRVVVLPLPGRTGTATRNDRPSPVALLDMARYVLALARWLRRSGADVVHGNSLKANLYGSLAARLAGLPFVWHARDRVAEDYMPRAAVRLVRLAVLMLPTGVIANSEATRATLGLTRTARVVGSPVVADAVLQDPPRHQEGDGPFTVAVVGRLAPWKGQDVVLRSFVQAFPDGPERLHLVGSAMFGEDDYEASLRSLAVELGIDDRTDFRGFRDDVTGEMALADVVVHASVVPEPFGQVVIEGMAAGRPVVATDAGGPAEIISDGVDGLLVPPGDVPALASALRQLAKDEQLRARLAAAGHVRSRDFSVERTAAAIREVYDLLLATGSTQERRAMQLPYHPGRRRTD